MKQEVTDLSTDQNEMYSLVQNVFDDENKDLIEEYHVLADKYMNMEDINLVQEARQGDSIALE